MNYLYLIGNGFDLAHEGMKTSYNDFILDYFKKALLHAAKNSYTYSDNLIDITNVTLRHDFLSRRWNHNMGLNELIEDMKSYNAQMNFKNTFFRLLVQKFNENSWVDIEYFFFSQLKRAYREGSKAEIYDEQFLKDCNQGIEELKIKLVDYLINLTDGIKVKKIRDIEDHFSETGNNNCQILNFNYTKTLEEYVPKELVLNIHGSIDKPNDIIFGYGDEQDKIYEDFESTNLDDFIRNFKSFRYFNNSIYFNLIKYIDSARFKVIIMGHSCGISDKILLNTIFEHPNCYKIEILYYDIDGERNDYFDKTLAISRNFSPSKKSVMRVKVLSKDASKPLVKYQPK